MLRFHASFAGIGQAQAALGFTRFIPFKKEEPMEVTKRFCSIPEAARICGVSRTTMWNWVKCGHIDAFVTPGGHHRLSREEIDRIVSERNTQSKPVSVKTVLIVDDDPGFRKTLKERLSRAGYVAEIARDGFEAGLKVREIRPDLVVLDLFMPGMDGFEVCRKIKQNEELKKIKILAVTGYGTPEIAERILRLGADAYQPKSTEPKNLMRLIRNVLSEVET
jgi:excisionase family DNA binding protein